MPGIHLMSILDLDKGQGDIATDHRRLTCVAEQTSLVYSVAKMQCTGERRTHVDQKTLAKA